jgi:hypothetical protein
VAAINRPHVTACFTYFRIAVRVLYLWVISALVRCFWSPNSAVACGHIRHNRDMTAFLVCSRCEVVQMLKVHCAKASIHRGQISFNPCRATSEADQTGIEIGYGLDARGIGVRVPVESRIFHFSIPRPALGSGLESPDYSRRGSAALTMRHPSIRKSWHIPASSPISCH